MSQNNAPDKTGKSSTATASSNDEDVVALSEPGTPITVGSDGGSVTGTPITVSGDGGSVIGTPITVSGDGSSPSSSDSGGQ